MLRLLWQSGEPRRKPLLCAFNVVFLSCTKASWKLSKVQI